MSSKIYGDDGCIAGFPLLLFLTILAVIKQIYLMEMHMHDVSLKSPPVVSCCRGVSGIFRQLRMECRLGNRLKLVQIL